MFRVSLGLGIIGFFVPRVLGVGYDTISDILNNQLALKLLLLIAVCKAVALMISLGSGTSGGLLAPMFMASAALGGVFAILVNQIISVQEVGSKPCGSGSGIFRGIAACLSSSVDSIVRTILGQSTQNPNR